MLTLLVAGFIVNTEAGRFLCQGRLVHLDSQGVPSTSDEPGGMRVACVRMIENRDTI